MNIDNKSFDKFFTLNTPNGSSNRHIIPTKEYSQPSLYKNNVNSNSEANNFIRSFLDQSKFSKINKFYKNFEKIFNEVTSNKTFMSNWFENLFNIFQKEIKFIFNFLKLSSSPLSNCQKFKLMKNNIFIYKENLKHILSISMEEFYQTFLDTNLNELINKVL